MNWLDTSISLWGLFLSAFISSTLAPGGSEALLALLASQSQHSYLLLLVTASIGNTLGALTTWGLGYWVARNWPPERLAKHLDAKALDRTQRWGVPVLLLSWLPVIGDPLCFAAGWLRFPFLLSLLSIAIGKVARYAVILYWFGSPTGAV